MEIERVRIAHIHKATEALSVYFQMEYLVADNSNLLDDRKNHRSTVREQVNIQQHYHTFTTMNRTCFRIGSRCHRQLLINLHTRCIRTEMKVNQCTGYYVQLISIWMDWQHFMPICGLPTTLVNGWLGDLNRCEWPRLKILNSYCWTIGTDS